MIHWNVDPEIFQLGPISLRWYSLCFLLAFLIGFQLMRWIYRKENKPEKELDSLLMYVILGTIIGARLGHCIFYDPKYYFSHPLEILQVWKGGLASHGGVAGILLALFFYTRKHKNQPYLWLVDRMAIPSALGASFIRVGNLFNSEIIGTPTDLPWSFVFERVDAKPRHPTQLYEAVTYLIIFFILLALYKKLGPNSRPGFFLGFFLILVFICRFFLEFVKVEQAAFDAQLPLSMGQLLSIPLVIVGIVLLLRNQRAN